MGIIQLAHEVQVIAPRVQNGESFLVTLAMTLTTKQLLGRGMSTVSHLGCIVTLIVVPRKCAHWQCTLLVYQ